MDEPNYQLTDGDGNVIGEIGAGSDDELIIEHTSGEAVTIDEDGLSTPSVSIEEATINGHRSDWHHELLESFEDSSDAPNPIDVDLSDWDSDQSIITISLNSRVDSDASIYVQLDNYDSSSYDYLIRDGTSFSLASDESYPEDRFMLYDNDYGFSDGVTGEWRIGKPRDVVIYGNGSGSRSWPKPALVEGRVDLTGGFDSLQLGVQDGDWAGSEGPLEIFAHGVKSN